MMATASRAATEIAELRRRLEEAEQTLIAIRRGEVDALVVKGENGPQVYTLKSAAEPYQKLVEQMREGALTLSKQGVILYCNEAFARMVGRDAARLTSSSVLTCIAENDFERLAAPGGCPGYETTVKRKDRTEVPVFLSSAPFHPDGVERISVIVTDMTEQQLRRGQGADLDAMTKLHQLGSLFVREDDLQPVLGEIIDAAIAITCADFGTFQLFDPESGQLRMATQRGFPQWWLDFWGTVTEGGGVCGTALQRGERVIVADIEQSPIFAGTAALEIQLRAGVRAVQSTPVISRAGTPLGMISTHFKSPHEPSERVLRLLDLLARQAADILERKGAEDDVRESEERLRKLYSAMNDGLAMHEVVYGSDGLAADYRVLDVNPAYERITGIRRERAVGALASVLYGTDAPPYLDIFARVVETGTPDIFEADFAPMGKSFRISVFSPARGQFATVFADITGRKQAEAEREWLLGEVQTERDRISALVASMADEVWFADPEGRFTLANAAARKEFKLANGVSVEVEKLAVDLEVLRPDGSPRPVQECPPLRALKGETITNQEEIIRTPAMGELRYRQVNATPVRDNAGRIIGSVSVVRDITDRKRAEEQVHLLMREVNHRAKNMLSLVLAIAQQTDAAGHEDFIDRFSERIHALAASQDLLVRGEWKGVELCDLVDSQLAHFGDLLDSRITKSGPPLQVSVRAAQAIGMALHELATNSGKYGALSNDIGCVEITWGIEQSDEAAGFVMSWRERGGPEAKAPSRRGFGSYVVRNMIEASLEATVSLDFAVEGLTWRVQCLANAVADGYKVRRASGNGSFAPAGAVAPDAKPRVLIVEDEPIVAVEIANTLKGAGFDIVGPAGNLAQALDLLRRGGCDTAVLDINLGEETSEPVAYELAKRGTPFVTLSAYGREQQMSAFRGAPALSKPVRSELLVAEVRRCIDAWQSENGAR